MVNSVDEVNPLRLELYGATMAKEGKRSTVVRGKPIVSDPTGLF